MLFKQTDMGDFFDIHSSPDDGACCCYNESYWKRSHDGEKMGKVPWSQRAWLAVCVLPAICTRRASLQHDRLQLAIVQPVLHDSKIAVLIEQTRNCKNHKKESYRRNQRLFSV